MIFFDLAIVKRKRPRIGQGEAGRPAKVNSTVGISLTWYYTDACHLLAVFLIPMERYLFVGLDEER